VASAYANLGSNSVELFRLDEAERILAEGLAYSAERDLDRTRLYMLAWQATAHLFRGRWAVARQIASEVLGSPTTSSNARWAALLTLGRLAARAGDAAEAAGWFDQALERAGMGDEIQLV